MLDLRQGKLTNRLSWEELAGLALQKRGYLVCASPRILHIGEIVRDMTGIPGVPTHQPFRVVGHTNWEDYAAQAAAVGVKHPYNPYGAKVTFYRVCTD